VLCPLGPQDETLAATSVTTHRRRRNRAFTAQVREWRTPLLWLAVVRGVLAIVAIPLAPFLYREHFVVLVLLRPTKEVLLAAGFLTREGDVGALPVLAAALPLALFGVWLFYLLGHAYGDEITRADLPGVAGRVLSPKRINELRDGLSERGWWVVLVGRLAAFPSSLMAAAAGSSEMPPRRFLLADGLGAALSVAACFGAGLLLGEAYEQAGPWLTVVGVVALVAVVVGVGAWLRRVGSSR
jgi:membrane-associated protein